MRKFGESTWEIWVLMFSILGIVALPVLVGALVVKLYRIYRPIEPSDNKSLTALTEPQGDGFIKVFIVGWGICGPIFYWVYQAFQEG